MIHFLLQNCNFQSHFFVTFCWTFFNILIYPYFCCYKFPLMDESRLLFKCTRYETLFSYDLVYVFFYNITDRFALFKVYFFTFLIVEL